MMYHVHVKSGTTVLLYNDVSHLTVLEFTYSKNLREFEYPLWLCAHMLFYINIFFQFKSTLRSCQSG